MNKNLTIDNLDTPNPRADHDGPWSLAPRPAPRDDWRNIIARWTCATAAAGVAWLVAPEWAHFYVTAAALGLGTLAGAKHILTDMIGGVAVRTWRNDVRATDIVAPLGLAAVEHARRALPNVSSYSPSIQQLPAGRGQVVEGQVVEAPAQLPAPINVGPLAIPDWLTALDAQPHAIFAARTKGGKSTMAKVGLKRRVDRGEDVFVIDPHSNGWLDLPAVGGGLNWPEIELAMLTVLSTYRARMAEREEHMRETGRELPHDHFPRLTIVFDEANESRSMIEQRHKGKTNPWPLFVEIMGSGARKVGISLWLICQSALIKNLGGSTVMRRNFSVFALDHATIVELIEDEEPIKARREAIVTQLGGATFPAATVLDGQAFLLDRVGLDQMVPPSAADCAWGGWDYAQRQPRNVAPIEHRTLGAGRPSADLRASVAVPSQAAHIGTDGRTDGQRYDPSRALAYLRWFVRQGKNRDDARAWFDAKGLEFSNKLYTEARRLEGKLPATDR